MQRHAASDPVGKVPHVEDTQATGGLCVMNNKQSREEQRCDSPGPTPQLSQLTSAPTMRSSSPDSQHFHKGTFFSHSPTERMGPSQQQPLMPIEYKAETEVDAGAESAKDEAEDGHQATPKTVGAADIVIFES